MKEISFIRELIELLNGILINQSIHTKIYNIFRYNNYSWNIPIEPSHFFLLPCLFLFLSFKYSSITFTIRISNKKCSNEKSFFFSSFVLSWQFFSFVFFPSFILVSFLNFFGVLNIISVFRLWAEVFHVAASGAGQVKWQQVSEDLVPVNITCIQDSPECVFHITAYNSQVDKILDVRLVQPGEYKINIIEWVFVLLELK